MKASKKGSARWTGGIKDGKGLVSTESGALKEIEYGFKKRFEGEPGTNPEELIGAAHASCFVMALSLMLEEAGHKAESLKAESTVTIEKQGDGFVIPSIHLNLEMNAPGIEEKQALELANQAKEGCPVSKVLNAKISLDAKLV